ncbi:SRPBCC family protein [Undibacterium sp. TJN19]|uniref:SRPBCC family protein n=1 Tax=Undibacterium sp. TJN19 TaxID=3413055 RepID=UPI003BF02902
MMIIAIILLLIVALLLFAATRPDDFRIERSLQIQARPEQVFSLINDFHEWEAWSPWEKVDPAVKRSYSGSDAGKGAIYAWQGNKQLGEGRMEILETQPYTLMRIQISFIKPFKAQNTIEFHLVPKADGTEVSESMFGRSNFISKLMGVFCNMDKMVGSKFDEGLRSLKDIAEKPASA